MVQPTVFRKIGALVLALALAVPTVVGGQDQRTRVLRLDEPSGVVVLEDGRTLRIGPTTVIIVSEQPLPLASLQPGMEVEIRSAELVTFRDGRYVAITEVSKESQQLTTTAPAPSETVIVQAPAETVTVQIQRSEVVVPPPPPADVVIAPSPAPESASVASATVITEPAVVAASRQEAMPPTAPVIIPDPIVKGTVASVDVHNSQIVLDDGRRVYVGPKTVVFRDPWHPIDWADAKPGMQVTISGANPVISQDGRVILFNRPFADEIGGALSSHAAAYEGYPALIDHAGTQVQAP